MTIKRLRFFFEKISSPHFMWGHPDEFSDAEWYYYKKGLK